MGSTTSFREWSAEVQPFVTRLSDCLLSYLREINTPSRMILFLVATIFCYVALPAQSRNRQGERRRSIVVGRNRIAFIEGEMGPERRCETRPGILRAGRK